jgi:nitrogen fixation protein FixH
VVTGRTVLVCLLAFFGVVAGVNGIMIRAAVSTFGGVETESSYKAGLAFAREAEEARSQDALHWRVDAKLQESRDGPRRLLVEARDAAGRPLHGLSAFARLVHPVNRRADRIVSLQETHAGQFGGTAEAPAGQWDLVIELSRDGSRVFRSRNRIAVN